jgi:hypothetical protein
MFFEQPRIPVFVILSVLLALTWISLSLRLWVRIGMTNSFAWDDGILVVSTVSERTNAACSSY